MSETMPAGPLGPDTTARVADQSDRYDAMMRLADAFDTAGAELRTRSGLGAEILRDPAVAESADLTLVTHARAEDDIRSATTGKHGLLTRSLELDADALVVRATVLTYQWIDELREEAATTLGSIAGRAIGFLAPSVELGGAIVSAGLIETDALDRDSVAAYLNELAVDNPELMDHVTSGGGGLLDGLQMRALLTAGFVSGESGRQAARGGLRALGLDPMPADSSAAVRDVAGSLVSDGPDPEALKADEKGLAPESVLGLMTNLVQVPHGVVVHRVGAHRYIAYLGGPEMLDAEAPSSSVRLVSLVAADVATYSREVVRAIEAVVDGDPDAHVLLVGTGAGGVVAAELAAAATSDLFVVDQVVTAGAPAAHVPRLPEGTRMLALEDRDDPVALLGSLVNAGTTNRTTVVFDAGGANGEDAYVAGGRAADRAAAGAEHPDLTAELDRLRSLGYLTATRRRLAPQTP